MYIDPHVHMVSRTTDDYVRMARAGCVAITEPAFWAGYDRSSPKGFFDYFRQLTESEPRRAAPSAAACGRHGISRHLRRSGASGRGSPPPPPVQPPAFVPKRLPSR